MSLTTLKSALKLGAAAIVTCALVLLNPVAAQAMQADPVTVTMTDDCGFVNISIPNGAMYGVVWNEPFTIMVAAKHTAPTNCAPRGDLPVTGPRVALAAGLGGLLLLTGFALYFVARRSRIRSV